MKFLNSYGGKELILNEICLTDDVIEVDMNNNETNEKDKLQKQMIIMEKEIENLFINKQRNINDNQANDSNIQELKENIQIINEKSDDFIEKMQIVKEQINGFSETIKDIQRKKLEKMENLSKKIKNEKKSEIPLERFDAKIQNYIDNILNFQKDMIDTNAVLTEYALYFDGIENNLENFEQSVTEKPNNSEKVR